MQTGPETQVAQFEDKFQNLLAVFRRVLSENELTFSRVMGTAEQVYRSGLENLDRVVTLLLNVKDMDREDITARIAVLQQKPTRTHADDTSLKALQDQAGVFDQTVQEVDELLAGNEEALATMDKAGNAAIRIKDRSASQTPREIMAEAMGLLDQMIVRANNRQVSGHFAGAGPQEIKHNRKEISLCQNKYKCPPRRIWICWGSSSPLFREAAPQMADPAKVKNDLGLLGPDEIANAVKQKKVDPELDRQATDFVSKLLKVPAEDDGSPGAGRAFRRKSRRDPATQGRDRQPASPAAAQAARTDWRRRGAGHRRRPHQLKVQFDEIDPPGLILIRAGREGSPAIFPGSATN